MRSPSSSRVSGNLFLARAELDRRAEWRTEPELLATAWHDPRSRLLRLATAARFPVERLADDATGLRLTGTTDADLTRALFLGVDADAVAYFALLPPDEPDADADPAGTSTLREVGALLPARDTGIAVNATALAAWHATHTHCPRCGAPTRIVAGGHVRECTADASQHYPRTDAAVIMAVVDADDRLLLGRQAGWPERRFSTLAGFVEPGESLEAAVRREVAEEVGVVVTDVAYEGSQPWPFPASLMLGFTATALTTAIRVDGEEIAEARWLTRHDLAEQLRSGELRLPPVVSIARRLIEAWYGEELPGEDTWR